MCTWPINSNFAKRYWTPLCTLRKFRFLNNNIHCRGQVIDEYCRIWFRNLNFSLHRASRYWTHNWIKRKLCSSVTILLDGFIVMCSNKHIPYSTISYVMGKNTGEFGELTAVRQCFTYRYFPCPNIFNRHLLL